nr:hypothetical protein [Tanacetum cinerariifolium]
MPVFQAKNPISIRISDEFSRVQGELLSLAASAEFKRSLKVDQTKEEFVGGVEQDFLLFARKISDYTTHPLSFILQLEPVKLAHGEGIPTSQDTHVSPPMTKELYNEEWINAMVDVPSNEMADGAASDKPEDKFVRGVSYAVGEDARLPLSQGPKCAFFGPDDVMAALFIGEKDNGPTSSLSVVVEVDFRFSIIAFFALFLASSGSFIAASTVGLVLMPTDTSWLRNFGLMDAIPISASAFRFKDFGRCVIRNL